MAASSSSNVNNEENIFQQQGFVVVSWNVLHLIHEINHTYDLSPVINRYSIKENWSNEQQRLNDIIKTLSDILVKYSSIECFICLQEVPGDLLPMLDTMIHAHVGSVLINKPMIHVRSYPRVPATRQRPRQPLYTNPNENLVTIHYNPYVADANIAVDNRMGATSTLLNDRADWTQCPCDPGKGALTIVTSSGLTVVNIHVPFKEQHAISLLNSLHWPRQDTPFVLVGDINRQAPAFMRLIQTATNGKPSAGLLCSIAPDKPTRVGLEQDGTLKKYCIDHYLVSASLRNSTTAPALVYDNIGDISDHFPIILQFNSM
ncbi:unnamed protein product [Adineta ricciae]|uniref:Endonuclease/exonuclease/phosphatase domain-containing protein n=1 Tax=Adineta ricciae TaxID=249248 RepID=A0A814L2U6_ADIRI|nr:unnamed protein product [Adineta ricciae]CAF1620352.1 unnamed protein product [Adineta ricciae]